MEGKKLGGGISIVSMIKGGDRHAFMTFLAEHLGRQKGKVT